MNATSFMKELKHLSFEHCFNPYTDRCAVYDYYDAPRRRFTLLKKVLNAASHAELDSVWIGRDLGYRGGRRTGLAMTDDVHLPQHTARWRIENRCLTKGEAIPERTACVVWNLLDDITKTVFLWNVFPLHPHEPDNPFSNRAHNAKERKAGEEFLEVLLDFLQPKRLIAIGNDAEKSAQKYKNNFELIKVRHPSYGGQVAFIEQIQSVYGT